MNKHIYILGSRVYEIYSPASVDSLLNIPGTVVVIEPCGTRHNPGVFTPEPGCYYQLPRGDGVWNNGYAEVLVNGNNVEFKNGHCTVLDGLTPGGWNRGALKQ